MGWKALLEGLSDMPRSGSRLHWVRIGSAGAPQAHSPGESACARRIFLFHLLASPE
jgi:hypothetical protein